MKTANLPLGLSYDDVLLVPQHSTINSRSEVDLSTNITPRVKLNLPLISINMSDVTGVEMAITLGKLGGIGFLPRFFSPEGQAKMVAKVKQAKVAVGAAVGCKEGELERAELLVRAGADIITLDVAHGAMLRAIETTKILKQKFGRQTDIVAGVVATYEGANDLYRAGADCVRVGVGPGTICITRIVTGVGVPQITAVINVAQSARQHKKYLLCDGGTSNSGDIMKGLAAGAHGVIIGSQLAGTDEAPGKIIVLKGKKFKQYNASTSYSEKKNHLKQLNNTNGDYIKHIEGVESLVPCRGPVSKIINYFKANLRAGFSYCGARNLAELHQKAEFIRVTSAGLKESQPHNVLVIEK